IKTSSTKSITYKICDLYSLRDLSIDEIAIELNFGKAMIKSNLKLGFEVGLCKRKKGDENLFITTKKPVIQLDKDLNFIKKWDSVNEATRETLKSQSGKISAACKNRTKFVGGSRWLYENDYDSY